MSSDALSRNWCRPPTQADIAAALTSPEARQRLAGMLRRAAKRHDDYAKRRFQFDGKERFLGAATDYKALADLYERAEHAYQDAAEHWRDLLPWRPGLSLADAPFSSPGAMCTGG